MLWQNVARPVLFRFPAERAHELSMGSFSWLTRLPLVSRTMRSHYSVQEPSLRTSLWGLDFQNPVGLAAGFDKNARWFPKLADLGFGHVEVGTLTGQPQPGNPLPRLFRLPRDRAIVNRMGFNNEGSDAAARRLAKLRKSNPRDIVGINIGKTKIVPVEQAVDDYLFSFERLFGYADYFTINVSSPNTPGLRSLQNRDPLLRLLSRIQALNQILADDHGIPAKPVLLKIAPDITDQQLSDIVSITREVELAGVIATNTTLSRDGLKTPPDEVERIGDGGLSGAPLTLKSRAIVSQLYQELDGRLPIIGVGGIMNGEDAWKMILAGASLVQIYTGFIYGGPGTVRDINRYLAGQLKQQGWTRIEDAVGQQHRQASR